MPHKHTCPVHGAEYDCRCTRNTVWHDHALICDNCVTRAFAGPCPYQFCGKMTVAYNHLTGDAKCEAVSVIPTTRELPGIVPRREIRVWKVTCSYIGKVRIEKPTAA